MKFARTIACSRVGSLAFLLCCWTGVKARAATATQDAGNVQAASFSEHLVWNDFSYIFGVQAADLDGDGFPDLTAADTAAFTQTEPFAGEEELGRPAMPGNNLPAVSGGAGLRHSNLYWFQNDGKGNFTRRFITRDDPQRRLERHVIADMNGDGNLDVVVVDNLLGDVVWYENPGKVAISKGDLWQKHFIAKGTMLGAVDVTVADFDGDGLPDVAAAGWRMGNCFRWFKNPGKKAAEEWMGWTIDGGYPGATCVVAGDLNNDGRPDIFTTSRNSRAIIWYECPKDPVNQSWRRNVVDLTPGGEREPVNLKLIDLNGDGRLDAVVAWGGYVDPVVGKPRVGSVVWYEQAGIADGRLQWKKHLISDELPGAVDVAVGDLNGDGRVDVAAIGYMPGEVVWFENPGNPAARWARHSLKTDWPNGNQVIIADFNHDGRMDIAAVADYGAMELRWWRNEGKR